MLNLFLQLPPQLFWRIGTEILHHHPNSRLEDYNNIYERMKHSGVKHYLMVCWLVDLTTQCTAMLNYFTLLKHI